MTGNFQVVDVLMCRVVEIGLRNVKFTYLELR